MGKIKKETIAKKKNRTLMGLIMYSESSGAIYYWKRGNKMAEVISQIPLPPRKQEWDFETTIIPPPSRPKGMLASFDDTCVGINKKNKIVILPTHGLGWTILKEIHNDNKK